MIAIALANDPQLLVADEPTTALDVTTQAQIIELVEDLQRRLGTAVVWISHDLGVIARVAEDVIVMRDGNTIEHRPTTELLDHPGNGYTRDLLAARPLIGKYQPPTTDPDADVVLEVNHLDVQFPVNTPTGTNIIHAVQGVSFTLRRGHTLGIVGESGSGKTTIANTLTHLVPARSGTATLNGQPLLTKRTARTRPLRRQLAMVFQDPFSSLDPKAQIGDTLGEPLSVHRLAKTPRQRNDRIAELLELVQLPPTMSSRYPHELSGGQRQRVSIARALALEPAVIILDEATASLDVSIQADVLDLLAGLQRELGLTYLFIAHNLAIVQQMSHHVLVLKAGRTQEYRATADLFAAPQSEYTRSLLDASRLLA
jgi:peptide/nickel transport system ATP-binding protein